MRSIYDNGPVVNVSATTAERWSQEQKDATAEIGNGTVIEAGSPRIPANATYEEIKEIAQEKMEEIKDLNPSAIVLAGESTFMNEFARLCAKENIPALAGMSERNAIETIDKETGEVKKEVRFEFRGYMDIDPAPVYGIEKPEGPAEPVFINLSNHPSEKWGPEQKAAAEKYGKIVDVPFPQIAPDADASDLENTLRPVLEEIMGQNPSMVMCQGQTAAVPRIVATLEENGIKTCAACTERENGADGRSVYKFTQFRDYGEPETFFEDIINVRLDTIEEMSKTLSSKEDVDRLMEALNSTEGMIRDTGAAWSLTNEDDTRLIEGFYDLKADAAAEIMISMTKNPEFNLGVVCSCYKEDMQYDKIYLTGENTTLTILPETVAERSERGAGAVGLFILNAEQFPSITTIDQDKGEEREGSPGRELFDMHDWLQDMQKQGEYVSSRDRKEIQETYENFIYKYQDALSCVRDRNGMTGIDMFRDGFGEMRGMDSMLSDAKEKTEEKIKHLMETDGLNQEQAEFVEERLGLNERYPEEKLVRIAKNEPELAFKLQREDLELKDVTYVCNGETARTDGKDDFIIIGANRASFEEVIDAINAVSEDEPIVYHEGVIVIPADAVSKEAMELLITMHTDSTVPEEEYHKYIEEIEGTAPDSPVAPLITDHKMEGDPLECYEGKMDLYSNYLDTLHNDESIQEVIREKTDSFMKHAGNFVLQEDIAPIKENAYKSANLYYKLQDMVQSGITVIDSFSVDKEGLHITTYPDETLNLEGIGDLPDNLPIYANGELQEISDEQDRKGQGEGQDQGENPGDIDDIADSTEEEDVGDDL